jgi:hypothetical protein
MPTSRMVLPERTVDLWTAAYITKRERRARLWAPTERGPNERYDLAAGLAEVSSGEGPSRWPNKVFVLEHKGVRLNDRASARHQIHIGIEQLWNHLKTDAEAGGSVLYYLLPALATRGEAPNGIWWQHPTAPAGQLPTAAALRVVTAHGPGFENWAVVVSVLDLFCHLYRKRALRRSYFEIDPAEAWDIQGAVSLKQFLTRVRKCQAGRRVKSLGRYLDSSTMREQRELIHTDEFSSSVRTFYAVGSDDEERAS